MSGLRVVKRELVEGGPSLAVIVDLDDSRPDEPVYGCSDTKLLAFLEQTQQWLVVQWRNSSIAIAELQQELKAIRDKEKKSKMNAKKEVAGKQSRTKASRRQTSMRRPEVVSRCSDVLL